MPAPVGCAALRASGQTSERWYAAAGGHGWGSCKQAATRSSGSCQESVRTSATDGSPLLQGARLGYLGGMPSAGNEKLRRALMIGCLGVALMLIARLGYEAVSAARAHRRTTESVLRDYAGLAAEQYARSAAIVLD